MKSLLVIAPLIILLATSALADWPQLIPPNSEIRAANEWGVVLTQPARLRPAPRLVWLSRTGETLTDIPFEPLTMAGLQFVRILNDHQLFLFFGDRGSRVVTLIGPGRWIATDYAIPADQIAQFRNPPVPSPTGFYQFTGPRILDRIDFASIP